MIDFEFQGLSKTQFPKENGANGDLGSSACFLRKKKEF